MTSSSSLTKLMGWVFVGSEISHRCQIPKEVGKDDFPFYLNQAELLMEINWPQSIKNFKDLKIIKCHFI